MLTPLSSPWVNRILGALLASSWLFPIAACAAPLPRPVPDPRGGGAGGWGDPVAWEPVPGEPQPGGQPPGGSDAADSPEAAAAVIDAIWRRDWNRYFPGSYLSPAVYGPYDESSDIECGGEPAPMNNAFYCPDGPYIAWDPNYLQGGGRNARLFAFKVEAHEYAHSVQDQAGDPYVSEAPELQADCLAGAVTAVAVQDGSLTLQQGDAEALVAAIEDTGDPSAWAGDPAAHGSGDERVQSFVLGFSHGVPACLPESR